MFELSKCRTGMRYLNVGRSQATVLFTSIHRWQLCMFESPHHSNVNVNIICCFNGETGIRKRYERDTSKNGNKRVNDKDTIKMITLQILKGFHISNF
jgi:hypothetical protein